jgi:myosin-crossreactive antigen
MSKTDESLFRIGRATTEYYKQLNAQEITENEFKLWIKSLQEPMRGAFSKKGLNECRGVLNLQRFVLELQDKGLEEYLKRELSKEDYSYYLEQSKQIG